MNYTTTFNVILSLPIMISKKALIYTILKNNHH